MTDTNRDASSDAWAQTISGRAVTLLAMRVEDVDIGEIAASLSKIARYNGHTRGVRGYSVAQHSVLCANLIKAWGGGPVLEREALLHDAAEAYYGDVTWPVQMAISQLHRTSIGEQLDAVRRSWAYVHQEGDDVAHEHDGKLIESAVNSALEQAEAAMLRCDPLRDLKRRVDAVVRKALRLAEVEPALVRRADMVALAIERRNLMAPCARDWQLAELADPRFRSSVIQTPWMAHKSFEARLGSIDARIASSEAP
jgi:hypothetical protein